MEPLVTTYLQMLAPPASRCQQFAGANFTAGGREAFANRPREAGDSVLVKTERAQVSDQELEVRELTRRDWKFNREMYLKVGENWKWIDRRPWTDGQWKNYANDPNLRTFAGYCAGKVAGYYELKRESGTPAATKESIEIAYFGLLPEFIGRGLGGARLTSAIENAWAWAPTPSRVWVHTCNRDHSNALANYQARGFKIYKTVTSDV
jgi:GNAT superfamily N-acetyltransferase